MKIYLPFFLLFFLLNSCIDSYNPPEINQPLKHLVVQGFININGVSTFKLSTTRNLNESTIETGVTGASISIQGEDNSIYVLEENGKGVYKSHFNILPKEQKYRINISNAEKNYKSDFVEAKVSPEIDSLGYDSRNDGLQLFINTHDPLRKSNYYKWEYDEIWKFHAAEKSLLIYDGISQLRLRYFPEEDIYYCYDKVQSSKIILANTTKLSEDLVYKNPFYFIDLNSTRLQIRYKILVRQSVLTEEGYNYWENMKKISEIMGSLFDPQPSQFKGNIFNVSNPDEMVIGFISAGTTTEKVIYINNFEIPSYIFKTFYSSCVIFPYRKLTYSFFEGGIPIALDIRPSVEPEPDGRRPPLLHYGSKECNDCSVKGLKQIPDDFKEYK